MFKDLENLLLALKIVVYFYHWLWIGRHFLHLGYSLTRKLSCGDGYILSE